MLRKGYRLFFTDLTSFYKHNNLKKVRGAETQSVTVIITEVRWSEGKYCKLMLQ